MVDAPGILAQGKLKPQNQYKLKYSLGCISDPVKASCREGGRAGRSKFRGVLGLSNLSIGESEEGEKSKGVQSPSWRTVTCLKRSKRSRERPLVGKCSVQGSEMKPWSQAST